MCVSVLFSEPKIPQSENLQTCVRRFWSFSALQRAENSSIVGVATTGLATGVCFSALQRAENSSIRSVRSATSSPTRRFSALQRAENSSIRRSATGTAPARRFQCSSASRKFLNFQRVLMRRDGGDVSVLFSEPKIPQSLMFHLRRGDVAEFQCSSASRKFLNYYGGKYTIVDELNVSVLFSEPKIPQSEEQSDFCEEGFWFQCSSASRKFLNGICLRARRSRPRRFQCSSASRKFLNQKSPKSGSFPGTVSVLFSEPKIPQFTLGDTLSDAVQRFSALQRAENSSMLRVFVNTTNSGSFQCSSASRKFLNW